MGRGKIIRRRRLPTTTATILGAAFGPAAEAERGRSRTARGATEGRQAPVGQASTETRMRRVGPLAVSKVRGEGLAAKVMDAGRDAGLYGAAPTKVGPTGRHAFTATAQVASNGGETAMRQAAEGRRDAQMAEMRGRVSQPSPCGRLSLLPMRAFTASR